MGGMGGLLAKTGGFKRKSKNKSNAVNKQDKDAKETESKTSTLKRKRSRSFSKGITDKPMIVNSTMLTKNALKSSTTKTEEKIMEVVAKKDNIVQIRCFAALTEYILYRKGENGKGLMIESFVDNKYGKKMQESGIATEWILTKMEHQNVAKKSHFIVKNQLITLAQMNGKKGYVLTFECRTNNNSQKEKEQQSVAKKIENVLKSELVKEENGSKTIKFFANYELYFKFSKGANGKGMIVEEAIDAKFGEYGIGKGWKLSKLGRRNVIKSSFIMLKNQLMAQASTAKLKGYELTFIDDAFKENSASMPNSPNIASVDGKQNKIPKTVPLKPVIAPNTNESNIKLNDAEIQKTDDEKVEIVSNKLNKNDTKKNEIVSNEEPKLKQAKDPFATMSEINIADKQQKEDNEQRNKMNLERKNSMPTNPNKPSFRPKIDKQQIKKYKPPSTQTTSKESEESMPTFTVFTNEKSEEYVNKNSNKKEEKIENKMAIKSNIVKKEKEKRKEAIVSNPHHRKTSSFKIRPKQK